jgi:hypothetical protein
LKFITLAYRIYILIADKKNSKRGCEMSVNIRTHYRMDGQGIWVSFMARARDLSLYNVRPALRLTQSLVQWVLGAPSPRRVIT